MAGSDYSDDSTGSHAGSYASVTISDDGRRAQAQVSGASVPDDAPPLFDGAGTGVYDQGAQQFYTVAPDNERDSPVVRWSRSTAQWVSEHRSRIVKALIDISPVLIQGASSFVPGRAGTVLKGIGIAAQSAVAGRGLVGQYQQHRSGGHVDPVQVGASLTRLTSTVLNTYAAVGDKDSAVTGMVGGAGSWVAGAATAADVMHHAHTDPGRVADDPGYEMYGMHRNPALGNQPGQYPPGFDPTPAPPSSTSSHPVPTNKAPAGNFNLPISSTGTGRAPAEGHLSRKVQSKKHGGLSR
ncbi:hypothetical protein [Streptomyces sp. NEAU-W12]|uniref:hypothetical protein n=1 Tax=Streptomyces sp. NEAU-W12 TaxID=2994668 RepID=UPI00224AB551|nr:hypothetical protein [Streptomyces sp. NEAU-W12]MCX2922436.1 hypothetical protein [Streptomyces sp. NEAU-W12]